MASNDIAPTDIDIDLVTASLRADASDLRAFVEALAVKLEEAVPGAVSVDRRREGMLGPKRVRRIGWMRASTTGVACRGARSRLGATGSRPGRPPDRGMSMDDGCSALGERWPSSAQQPTTRQALQRLLNG